uniref:Uncharacterized protein n=1 Tax=Arundo donax TaxID=35708 RepID=A0A0A9BW29_ARUDO
MSARLGNLKGPRNSEREGLGALPTVVTACTILLG